jgi:hypothetical protein
MKTPNTKHQTPEKLQAPSAKLQKPARSADGGVMFGSWRFVGVWCLVFGVSLELGSWILELRPGV